MIIKTYPGRDGLIRSVDVKTKRGVFNRSIQTLHNLEINANIVDVNNIPKDVVVSDVTSDSVVHNEPENNDKDSNEVFTQDSNKDKVDVSVHTRRGRLVKKPSKLNL